MRDQHRLVVLLLVLGDHPEGEARAGETPRPLRLERGLLQHVEGAPADVRRVAARLVRREQRQARALRTRVLEGVVQRVDLGTDRLLARDRAQQPLLLLVPDVREIPDER